MPWVGGGLSREAPGTAQIPPAWSRPRWTPLPGPRRDVCSVLVNISDFCRRVLQLQAGGGTEVAQHLAGTGVVFTLPKPTPPIVGHRDPPQATTHTAPSPPGRVLVAMLGLVSPWWWRWELVLLWGA